MKQRKSEIFESYAAIAIEQGLISKAKSEDSVNPQDKEYLEKIEALYGIKPNGDKDILDEAHPEPVFISPSYDRLNGLVENLKEQHNIMVGIVMKPHQAKLMNHRYAAALQELSNEMIRLGFSLDNRNEIELAKLADGCSEKLIIKNAFFWMPILIGAGVAAAYTAISQNVSFSQGVFQDTEKALVEIKEATDEYPQLAGDLARLTALLEEIKISSDKARNLSMGVLQEAGPAHTEEDAAHSAKKYLESKSDEESIAILKEYERECVNLSTLLPEHIRLLKLREKQLRPTHSDFLELGYKAYRWLNQSNIEDVWEKLENLQKSLAEEPGLIENQISLIKDLRNKFNAVKDSHPMQETPKPTGAPTHEESKPAPGSKPEESKPKSEPFHSTERPKSEEDSLLGHLGMKV